MNYHIVWTPDAERDLAAVWLAAADQAAVTAAAYRAEQNLRRAPLSVGESRASGVNRVVWDPPLGIAFEVIEDDKRVFIHSVWAID